MESCYENLQRLQRKRKYDERFDGSDLRSPISPNPYFNIDDRKQFSTEQPPTLPQRSSTSSLYRESTNGTPQSIIQSTVPELPSRIRLPPDPPPRRRQMRPSGGIYDVARLPHYQEGMPQQNPLYFDLAKNPEDDNDVFQAQEDPSVVRERAKTILPLMPGEKAPPSFKGPVIKERSVLSENKYFCPALPRSNITRRSTRSSFRNIIGCCVSSKSENPVFKKGLVHSLNHHNFNDFLEEKEIALVLFYDKIDPKTIKILEYVDNAARLVKKHNQAFGVVDCNFERYLCDAEKVEDNVMLKLYSAGKMVSSVRDMNRVDPSFLVNLVSLTDTDA